MGPEWVAIIGLVALFAVGTAVPINMGALGFVAAWLVGMWSLDMDEKDIVAGISADLVLTLIGVTYLFAIAKKNGTVDLIVRVAVKAVRGRVALIPWVMFAITAVLTAIGAVSPAACAIIGPIALGFAGRYGISPLMMGMFVVHGAQAGGFSPISIYGTITNSVMEDAGLPTSELTVFFASLAVNTVMAAILFVAARRPQAAEPAHRPRRGGGRGGREARGRRRPGAARPDPDPGRLPRRRRDRADPRQEHRLRRDHRRGRALLPRPEALPGHGQADRLAHGAAGRRRQLLRHDPQRGGLAGVRRRLGRRARRRRDRRAGALLRRRRGLGVRQLDRAAAGDHPDRRPAGRRRRHQRGPLRRGARGLEHDRGRQPVLHQRRADAGQPAGLDQRERLLPADPDLQRDRGRGRSAAGLGGARPPGW